MRLTIGNFGGIPSFSATFESALVHNGDGKTSRINAYIWALTGKPLNGMTVRYSDAAPSDPTVVTLSDFIGMTVERTLYANGETLLLVDGQPYLQVEFATLLQSKGVRLDLVRACADAGVLTSPALTADDLRSLLVCADILDGGAYKSAKKRQTDTRAALKAAQVYALSNVTVPVANVEPLSDVQRAIIDRYDEAALLSRADVPVKCPCCDHPYSKMDVMKRTIDRDNAIEYVKSYSELATSLLEHDQEYTLEQQTITDAKRLIEVAKKARADATALETELLKIGVELKRLEEKALNAVLPAGVTVITEVKQKNGVIKDTCQLMYNGLPLKTVNYAKRVEICVDILAGVRAKEGLTNDIPIIIDNGESVQRVFSYPNVIYLSVPS